MHTNRTGNALLLAMILLFLSRLASAQAPDNTWLGGDGDWNVDSNWSTPADLLSPHHVPSSKGALENCVIPISALDSGPTIYAGEAGICNNLTVAGANRYVNLNTGYLEIYGNSIVNVGFINNYSYDGLQLWPPQGGTVTLSGGGGIGMWTAPGQLPARIRGYNTTTLVNLDNTINGDGEIGVNLTNQKLINANGGQLVLRNNIKNAGVIQSGPGSTLLFAGNNNTIDNAGGTIQALTSGGVILSLVVVNGGLITTSGGGVVQTQTQATLNNVTNAGNYFNVPPGNTILQGTVTNTGVLFAQNGGYWIDGTVLLTGAGLLTGNNGSNPNPGPLIRSLPGGSSPPVLINQSSISGGGYIGDGFLTLYNQGGIDATNPYSHLILFGPNMFNSGGLMEGTGGGTLEIANTQTNSSGTVKAEGGSFVLLDPNVTINGDGTRIVDGTLTAPAGINLVGPSVFGRYIIPGATLLGRGSVVGNVSSSGTVIPGDSLSTPQNLAIVGSYTQTGGVLEIGIVGKMVMCHGVDIIYPCPQWTQGQLVVSNNVSLSGTLQIASSGVAPPIGSIFPILSASAISGQFAAANGLSINSTEHFVVSYSSTQVALKVVAGP